MLLVPVLAVLPAEGVGCGAARGLADVLLAEPDAGWARFALEAVLKEPAEGV